MKSAKDRLVSVENQLRIAKACQKFKDTEIWKVIQDALTNEQNAYTKQLIADRDCTPQSIARLQGVIAAISWFLNLMDQRSARLADLDRIHSDLVKKVNLFDKMPKTDTDAALTSLSSLDSFGGKP